MPIVLDHKHDQIVGALTGLTTSDGWHVAAFTWTHPSRWLLSPLIDWTPRRPLTKLRIGGP